MCTATHETYGAPARGPEFAFEPPEDHISSSTNGRRALSLHGIDASIRWGEARFPSLISFRRTRRSWYASDDLWTVSCFTSAQRSSLTFRLDYYHSLQSWPEPIRSPLKSALKAKQSGDYDRSEAYFRK